MVPGDSQASSRTTSVASGAEHVVCICQFWIGMFEIEERRFVIGYPGNKLALWVPWWFGPFFERVWNRTCSKKEEDKMAWWHVTRNQVRYLKVCSSCAEGLDIFSVHVQVLPPLILLSPSWLFEMIRQIFLITFPSFPLKVTRLTQVGTKTQDLNTRVIRDMLNGVGNCNILWSF